MIPMASTSDSQLAHIKLPYQILIWFITLVFFAGMAYSNFVTKTEFEEFKRLNEEKTERMLTKIDNKFERIISKLDELQKDKVDKK